MKNVVLLLIPTLLLVGMIAACRTAESAENDASRAATTYVDVKNRSWLSMEIYVIGLSQRIRLGRVGSNREKRFALPDHLLSGATPLRFLMESSGAAPTTFTEEFVVAPGEDVLLIIPNTR